MNWLVRWQATIVQEEYVPQQYRDSSTGRVASNLLSGIQGSWGSLDLPSLRFTIRKEGDREVVRLEVNATAQRTFHDVLHSEVLAAVAGDISSVWGFIPESLTITPVESVGERLGYPAGSTLEQDTFRVGDMCPDGLTAVRDGDEDLWRRSRDEWTCTRVAGSRDWSSLLRSFGPVTRA